MLDQIGAEAQRYSDLDRLPIRLFYNSKCTKGKMRPRRLKTVKENGFWIGTRTNFPLARSWGD